LSKVECALIRKQKKRDSWKLFKKPMKWIVKALDKV